MEKVGELILRIVVAGIGNIGKDVIENLMERNHEVIAIDNDKDVCERISAKLGAKVVYGDAADLDVLKDARIYEADVCIGLVGSDSINLAFTVQAKGFDVPDILVRMKDPAFREAYKRAGADKILDLVDLYMNSLLIEIEHPSMQKVTELGSGEASIAIVEIPKDSPIKNETIAEIDKKQGFPLKCVFAGIYRKNQFIVPRGNEEIKPKDRVFLSGKYESIEKAAKVLGA